MGQSSLKDIFTEYVQKKPIFKNKEALSTKFSPQNIPHRDEHIKQLAHILAPVLRDERTSNVFIYGKTGTGKTLVARNVIAGLSEAAAAAGRNTKTIYVNCKMKNVSDTEYRLLAQLIGSFGVEVPYTGLPTNELYRKFFSLVDQSRSSVVIVLDEIDFLVNKIGDTMLYSLTRTETQGSQLIIIGISNNLSFIEGLDPRVRSSLSEESLLFPPYNANELRDILTERAGESINPGAASSGAIAKAAALAAQEHGDARKALDLLRVAGEIAERQGDPVITDGHVDVAEKKLDMDRVMETVRSQPKHSKLVMSAILEIHGRGEKVESGEVYALYSRMCEAANLKPLTQRRVSDLISELDMFGILTSSVVSKGRYGRTRAIRLNLPKPIIEKIDQFLKGEA
jgi:cell division control protein 6